MGLIKRWFGLIDANGTERRSGQLSLIWSIYKNHRSCKLVSIEHVIPSSENGPSSPSDLGGASRTDVNQYHREKTICWWIRSLGPVSNYQLKIHRGEGHFKIVTRLSIIIALLGIYDRAGQEPRAREDPQKLRQRRMFLLYIKRYSYKIPVFAPKHCKILIPCVGLGTPGLKLRFGSRAVSHLSLSFALFVPVHQQPCNYDEVRATW